ncbi:MAG: glycogen debranching protein, partial [Bacteroidetes bacterium]|nr:glycogen debranching protein [Bacteroidota bacterium]
KDAGAKHHLIKKLVLAGDQFLVEGKDHKKSIIAGYPWFCDWGRDTMISLPGLCLATGRNDDAQQILRSYAKWVSQGMIPNRFPEEGHEPLYNTIDATLWFFIAAFKYYQATKDVEFVRDELLPVLTDIIEWHQKGTRYGIRVDEDGLLTGGEPGVQLTWMDAIVGDWVVTPRIGKAVEINALWYNACEIYAYFNHVSGNNKEAKL